MQLILPGPYNSIRNQNEVEFTKNISSYKNFIIFSPHLDDAVLSMGSLLTYLATLNGHIKVINIFTKGSALTTTFTTRLLKQANIPKAEEYFLARKKEDKEALEKLGTIYIENLDFTDAAWRQTGEKLPLYPKTIIGNIHTEDTKLIEELEKRVEKISYDSSNTIIFGPLGRGHHIDHQIVRNTITKIFPKLIYYTDFPYSNQYENEYAFITTHNLSSIEWHGEYEKKRESIFTYESQKVSLFQPKNLQLVYESFYFSPESSINL